jgi:hypothetical protein
MSIGQGRSSDAAYTGAFGLWGAAVEYMIDATQRSVLFWDVMRQRGNQYRQHLAETSWNISHWSSKKVSRQATNRRLSLTSMQLFGSFLLSL